MKIDGKENVSVIRLEHRGFNLKFQQVNNCSFHNDINPLEIKPIDRVTIEFDDTLELDRLIAILQRFRDELWSIGPIYNLKRE